MRMPANNLDDLRTVNGSSIGVITPESGFDIGSFSARDHASLRWAIRQYGGLLFRGFPVDSVEAFRSFVRRFLEKQDSYLGGASKRTMVSERIYKTTDAPPDVLIEQHLEATHTPNPPRIIMFNCQIAPTAGGETTLASFAELAQALPHWILDAVHGQRIEYTKTLIDGDRRLHRFLPRNATSSLALSWQEATGTSSIKRAIASFENEGYAVVQLPNRSIRTRCAQPVIRQHSVLGMLCWQLSDQMTRPLPWHASAIRPLVRRSVGIDYRLESGEPFDTSVAELVHEHIDRIRFSFRWKVGDVLILDNEQMSHGRNRFTGERLILTAFGS